MMAAGRPDARRPPRAPAPFALGALGALGALAALAAAFGCEGRAAPIAPPPAASAASAASPRPAPAPAGATDLAPAAATAAARLWPPPAPGVRSEWCVEGVLNALDESTCYVLPDAPPEALLIYLHGIVPPGGSSPQKTNLEAVVASAARRAGVAALVPRGVQGLGPRGQERWWSWPTGEGSYRRRGPALAAAVADARRRFEAFAGVTFARVYVAGSSAGAYFVTELALHGGLRADGYGAISGGAARPTAEFASLAPAPFYVGHGTYDPAATSAKALGAFLRRAGWTVRVEAHPVPHGAHAIYLDEAFAFWRANAPATPAGGPGGAARSGAAGAGD